MARQRFGTWRSPIEASDLATLGTTVDNILVDPADGEVYIIEERPAEGGRNEVVHLASHKDVLGQAWNARSRVHEYGGASALAYDGFIYFSHVLDGCIYRHSKSEIVPVTTENPNLRYADFAIHPVHKHLLVCIKEDHTNDAPTDVKNSLILVDTRDQRSHGLVSGADFYSYPRFSSDGQFLAWRQWNHPDMPWEASEVYVAACQVHQDGITLSSSIIVAGKCGKDVATEPLWISAHQLLVVSDISGYLNPYLATVSCSKSQMDVGAVHVETEPLFHDGMEEDFGEPSWMLGWSSYAALDENHVVLTSFRSGRAQIYVYDLRSKASEEINTPFAVIQYVHSLKNGKVVFLGKASDREPAVVEFDGTVFKPLTKSKDPLYSVGYISQPQPMSPADETGNTYHAILYGPTNPSYEGGEGDERPPAVVYVHGGPTWLTDQALDWKKQYFTSRGWAWVDVNYGGSSGYGKAYRERLKGRWGVLDITDTVTAVHLLASQGIIDGKRTVIRGQSAGGFTTLGAVSTFPDAFAAGGSLYGVSDLRKLNAMTHKFEKYFCETLVGGLPEEIPQVWKERSPISKADRIKAPLLIMQGSLDRVVPPKQAEEIVRIIQAKGGKVRYVVMEDEGHGWKKSKNIQRALEEELIFYEEVFGFI
ncbi:alpha beta-hydrolase [Coniophora puteana RWD-64-598 SS2]|uniref:Alpha beta-hydrolase n=1 Tax=Coniophora puteana (strain RWD-64-598) TaxID=741705 RepID=A0A5M3N8L0_CONPW|nr:alpha beta-hydrolase [Coniophora puteana RWD-64-598 SS2]EIW87444.1 alpha beta-hydrolase [Coniophora puteana RWD-64-598 SS2]